MRPLARRFVCALVLAAAAVAQEAPAILKVDVEYLTQYWTDWTGPETLARTPGPLVLPGPALNFNHGVQIGDIVAVNGIPARGLLFIQQQQILLSPTPAAGQAISDLDRGVFRLWTFEILKSEGSPIGSLFAQGLGGGPPPPGSPANATQGNIGITGGTGAFFGVRGGSVSGTPAAVPARNTSYREDPSLRRVHGGGRTSFIVQLLPAYRPEVLIGADGPVVFHEDYSPVTSSKPARAGEILIVYAKGLGFTRPAVNPGDAFPDGPAFAVVNSPIDVLVNGSSSPALNQLGVPGTTDTYRVDFRVPAGAAAGVMNVQLSAAWVRGAAVRVPVQ